MTDPVLTPSLTPETLPVEVVADATPETTPQPEQPSELDTLRAELAEKSAALEKLQGEYSDHIRRQSLEGKVTDMNAAMKLLDPERHLNSDGTVNVHALYQEFPSLAPSVNVPTAPDGGGGPHFTGPVGNDPEEVARRGGSPTAINSAFDRLLKGVHK